MKLKLALVAVGFVILFWTPVHSQVADPHTLTPGFVYDNFWFKYKVSVNDLKNTPSWDPDSDEPPISIHKALGVARINLNRFVQGTEKFEVEHFKLERFGTDKWVFQVSFRCLNDGCFRTAPAGFIIFVKMDGSVIEPVVGPKPKPL